MFNARIVDMRHLWNPSTEYQGKPGKPNYFAMFIVQKTQAQWFTEPALAGIAQACGKLYATNPHIISWPVVDGDLPSPGGKSSEFAKGHWLFSASTGNSPNVEIVQAGGALTKLTNKTGVKSGDYCMAGVTAAVKQNDPRGVKLYLNAVVFSGPGEEIVFANSVSGAELMKMAQQQGLQVAGFQGAPSGFSPSPGFIPGNAGGFAPTQAGPASTPFASPLNGGGGSSSASPFSAGPGGFTSPANPFGPR